MDPTTILSLIAAAVFSGLIAFVMTPPVRSLAERIGAIDVPMDSRRIHKVPIPRMGGLAIFLGFMLASFLFAEISNTLLAIWLGGLVIIAMGVIDDVFRLHPFVKLLIQIAAALIVVSQGLIIEFVRVFDYYVIFDQLSVPVTILWIVCITNAMNLIDGLDGLSGGIAAITSLSLTIVMFLRGDFSSALLTAILFGACVGFLPFNKYPAKIFLGDTGSQFLGFLLSVLTLSGLFKMHAVISFFVPIAIFALPLFDTTFAFFRRLFKGKNPFKGDRGHLHHRLMDLGYSQKETVSILHAICGILGIAAVMFSLGHLVTAIYAIVIGAIVLLIYLCLLHPVAQIQEAEEVCDSDEFEAEDEYPYETDELYEEDDSYQEEPVAYTEDVGYEPPVGFYDPSPSAVSKEPEAYAYEPIVEETSAWDSSSAYFTPAAAEEEPCPPEPKPELQLPEGSPNSAPDEPYAESKILSDFFADQPESFDDAFASLPEEEPVLPKPETKADEAVTPQDEDSPATVLQDEIQGYQSIRLTAPPSPEAAAPTEQKTLDSEIARPHRLQQEEEKPSASPAESYLSYDGGDSFVPQRRRPRPTRTLPGTKK